MLRWQPEVVVLPARNVNLSPAATSSSGVMSFWSSIAQYWFPLSPIACGKLLIFQSASVIMFTANLPLSKFSKYLVGSTTSPFRFMVKSVMPSPLMVMVPSFIPAASAAITMSNGTVA